MRDSSGRWQFFLADDPRIAYLRVNTFGERTAQELKSAIKELREQKHLEGIIVDVRDNAGGLLEAAREVCDLFVDNGVIVTTQGRNGVVKKRFTASMTARSAFVTTSWP